MDNPRNYKFPLLKNSKSAEKMSTKPLIFPRISDPDVWSYPGYKHSATNFNNMSYDYSNEFTAVPQTDDYSEYDPRVATYTNFNLNKLDNVCESKQYTQPNGIYQQHPNIFNDDNYNNISTQRFPQNTTPLQPQPPQPPQEPPQPVVERYAPQYNNDVKHPYSYKNNYTTNKTNVKEPFNMTNNNTYPLDATNYKFNDNNSTNNNISNLGNNNTDIIGQAPPSDLLIPKTIDSVYGQGAVSNQERIKYFQNIEPSSYTLSDVAYPINANLGISYNPDIPPLVIDQTATPYGTVPLYHRIDPQLVRDQNIAPNRLNEMPRRDANSARYSDFQPAPGTVGFEDIYDPRFSGYGDEYRSYGDVNLGQVNYYYSDLDEYRAVHFPFRSNVDFIDFHTPQGKILPEYQAQIGVDDIKAQVGQQFDADQLFFRTNIMESQMRKRNAELWQLRASPMLAQNNTHSFSSGY
jgi:hypothetical protein